MPQFQLVSNYERMTAKVFIDFPMNTELHKLPIDALQAGLYQPREHFDEAALRELSQSIASQGLIEPIIVRPIAGGRYEIIAGERRWRAAKLAGFSDISCLVGNYTDKQACALTLIENIQRQDLNLIEEATGYRRLMDEFNYHQDEISALVGKSRSHIANILRLLSLTPVVKQYLREQAIGLGHARVLVGLDPVLQEHLAIQAVEEQWSVRQMEQAVKELKHETAKPKNPKSSRDVERLERLLSEQVGAPVQIETELSDGGWLKLKFFNNDTLAGLLERLGLRYD